MVGFLSTADLVVLLRELSFLLHVLLSLVVESLLNSVHIGVLDLRVLLQFVDFVDQLLDVLIFGLGLLSVLDVLELLLLLQRDDVLLVHLVLEQFSAQGIYFFLLIELLF